MRNLMLVCAALALIASIVSVNLWRELRAERQLTAQLRGDVQQAEERVAAAQAARVAPVGLVAQSTQNDRPNGETRAPAVPPVVVAAAPTAPAALDINTLRLRQQELMQDPEYRRARLSQTRLSLPQNYPGLAEELGLSQAELDRLFDLLAEQQLQMSDVTMSMSTSNGVQPDQATSLEASRRLQEMNRAQQDSLRAMLGDDGYGKFQGYQQTRGARQQVIQLGRTLDGMGQSLTPEQSRPLTAAYVAEQQRQQDELRQISRSIAQAGPMSPMEQERFMEERFNLQEQSNRRLVDAARAHLNAQQLQTLQSMLDQQLTMNRASSRATSRATQLQGQQGQTQPITVIQGLPLPIAVPVP